MKRLVRLGKKRTKKEEKKDASDSPSVPKSLTVVNPAINVLLAWFTALTVLSTIDSFRTC